MKAASASRDSDVLCSVQRSLDVLGDRWSLLILRESFRGVTRYSDFRAALGIAPDILSQRLGVLVEGNVLEKRSYREPGSRTRDSYHLTDAGEQAKLLLGALQQWGDDYQPHPNGPSALRRSTRTGRPLRVAFIEEESDSGVPLDDVDLLVDPSTSRTD
ncbi:winged helix-turn-helix transcriptional regulator [Pseudonocardia spinosispora]|uniref:winged helix-turn-helix transcriptional regulator n=1 Tax=Pseudonocardia spinosispora TaxID=103441 RepID=UPI000412CB82|nr:helix-turn-helix domain-containing protein [Pseudonocardia spinosispora]